MKKKALILSAALFLVCNASAGDEKGNREPAAAYSLQGNVYDPVCRESLSGATITVDGIKYYSDLDGRFFVPELKQGKHTLSVDFISYQSRTMEIDLPASRELNIELKQQ